MKEQIKKLIAEYENKRDLLKVEQEKAHEKLVQCELIILDLKGLLNNMEG